MTTNFINNNSFTLKPTSFGFFNFDFITNGQRSGFLMNTLDLFKNSFERAQKFAQDHHCDFQLMKVVLFPISTIDQYKWNPAARILVSTESETGYDWTCLNIAIKDEHGNVNVYTNEGMPWREDRTIYTGNGIRVEIFKK